MGEILFRGKCLSSNEWVYGYYRVYKGTHKIFELETNIEIDVDGSTVGRYIDIKDFKGADLFEGDLIKHPNQDEIGVIRYDKFGSQFRIFYSIQSCIPNCHIGLQVGKKGMARCIGNIHDNPKLAPS